MEALIKTSCSTRRETPFACQNQWISSHSYIQTQSVGSAGYLMLCARGHECCIIPGVTNESWHTKRNASLFGMLMWGGEQKHRRLERSPRNRDQFAPIGSSLPFLQTTPLEELWHPPGTPSLLQHLFFKSQTATRFSMSNTPTIPKYCFIFHKASHLTEEDVETTWPVEFYFIQSFYFAYKGHNWKKFLHNLDVAQPILMIDAWAGSFSFYRLAGWRVDVPLQWELLQEKLLHNSLCWKETLRNLYEHWGVYEVQKYYIIRPKFFWPQWPCQAWKDSMFNIVNKNAWNTIASLL